MMGWMHDILSYLNHAPVYRSYHQQQLAFSIYYAFSERFVLPLSHDEVVHGKYSLIHKMPGDSWQKFANLRLLYTYMWGHPGAKMIFMGGEFGQNHEWRHDSALDWHEAEEPERAGVVSLISELNALYKREAALYVHNFSYEGFEWIDLHDSANSVLCWVRKGVRPEDQLICVANFTPVVRHNYRIGVPARGLYTEVFNSDDPKFGGSGIRNDVKETAPIPHHSRAHSISLTLPPLGMVMLKKTGGGLPWFE
jgi:1,4-alpha-glucan branching enzyme